jgi:hypothetical protein
MASLSKDYDFDFFMIEIKTITKPTKITIGAKVIRRKLKISGLKTAGSSEPPPTINK